MSIRTGFKTKTTLDILNDNCKGEQILKGGNRIDEEWVSLDDANKEVDSWVTAKEQWDKQVEYLNETILQLEIENDKLKRLRKRTIK